MACIGLTSVQKVYPGGHQAVAGCSLDIPDGRFVVLVGPSGCGKSTTLRMIAGLEDITSGTISIDDTIINDVPPKDRDIAMVFQNYALYPHMTVAQNMGFALKMRKTPKAEITRRVNDTAALLGITELLGRKPRALSGGQRQRVAVGRAIVREPKAFLFDEPLSNLDARLRITMRAELKALHARLGTTTVYVTHDQEEAMTLGDVVVVMEGGHIRQVGPPLEVYDHPASRFVASFIGTPPMNFIEGTLTQGAAGPAFACPAATINLGQAAADRLGPIDEDAPAVLGVRPQAIELADPARSNAATLDATIEVVEPLGDRIDLSLRLADGSKLNARVPARRDLAPGQTHPLSIDPGAVHLFAPGEHGRSLMHHTEPHAVA